MVDGFGLSLVVGLVVSSLLFASVFLYLLKLRRQVSMMLKVRPKGRTLVLSHRDIGPIVGMDTVVEFEKVPDEEADNDKLEGGQDEVGADEGDG